MGRVPDRESRRARTGEAGDGRPRRELLEAIERFKNNKGWVDGSTWSPDPYHTLVHEAYDAYVAARYGRGPGPQRAVSASAAHGGGRLSSVSRITISSVMR